MTINRERTGAPAVQTIGFLLLDNFTLISLASAIEPLRMANQLAGRELYRWFTISLEGKTVNASDGLKTVPDASTSTPLALDMVIVCGGRHVTDAPTAALLGLSDGGTEREPLVGVRPRDSKITALMRSAGSVVAPVPVQPLFPALERVGYVGGPGDAGHRPPPPSNGRSRTICVPAGVTSWSAQMYVPFSAVSHLSVIPYPADRPGETRSGTGDKTTRPR